MAGKVSNAYTVFSANAEVEPRFFRWVLKSPGFVQELQSTTNQLRDGQSIRFAEFASINLPLPPLEEQRRIADFLDDQVTRIDKAIHLRQQQIKAVDQRFLSRWYEDARTLSCELGIVPLRRVLLSIVDGPFGSSLTSSHYSDSGTRVIRLGNIGRGEFRWDQEAYIPSTYAKGLRQHAAVEGDLIVAGLGDERWPLGRCAVVPPGLGPAIVKADCYRVRLADTVSAEFVSWFLSSPLAEAKIRLLARGSTRARLNTDVAREAPIVIPDRIRQLEIVSSWEEEKLARTTMAESIAESIDLLIERRRSLITAAVTGEFDVSSASSRAAETVGSDLCATSTARGCDDQRSC